MVKGRRNPGDKIKNIEDEVDRLIRRREKSKETMPEVLSVPDVKKRKEEYIKPALPAPLTEKPEAFLKMIGKVQNTFPSHATIHKSKTKKNRVFKKTDFPRPRIVKPVAVILVIAMILTSIQLLSFISTGETIIIPDDFGIPEEFENAKQEFETESIDVKQKAEGLLNNENWSVEEVPERNINYDNKTLISKEKPEWPRIFEDIEDAGITPESSYKSWTHTTNADFNNNCSDSMNVVIDDDMIKLQTLGVGMFISNPLDSGTDNAVLKDVTWHESTPGASQIVIIVEVSQTGDAGNWIPVWKSVDVIPDDIKVLFPDMGEFATEVVSGRYFRYSVGFSGGLLGKPQLEDITIHVATATVDRKYYVFTYYNNNLEVDKDGVAGGNVTQLGLTIPEYNYIDVDPDDGDADDIVVSLRLKGRLSDNETFFNLTQPPTYLIGGLEIEIFKINDKSPLTIYFVKPISYDNKTYIWIMGFYFSSLPEQFSFSAISENIVLQSVAFMMGGETPVNVQPPYEISWSMSSQIHEFALSVGYAKFGPVNATHYFEAKFSPGVNGYLYYEEIAEKLSLTWRGSNETDVSAYYKEENLYVEFKIDNLPSNVNLSIENGTPCSTLNYEASSVLSRFSYTSYDFGSGGITHVNISNIPSHICVIGTFEIPPKEEPNPDPSDTFIGRVLNYVIARIGATMQRVRKALTSITEIVSTPDNIFHLIPDGTISKIEFWSLKGRVENNIIFCERLNLSGNYIGMLNSSIQVGLKNVTEMNLSLSKNITIMLKSSSEEGFKAIAVYGSTEVLINIPKLPDSLSIKGTAEKIDYSSLSEKGKPEKIELSILAKTQNYNMDASIKNITSGVFTKKDQNISLEFEQPVELECAVGKGQLYKMTGNYFFTNTSEKTASLRIGNLKSLHLGEQTGLTLSEEYPMKIKLETNVTSGKILIKNLPRSFNVSLSSSLITLPEIENVSLAGVSDLFSSVANSLGEAMQNLDKTVREGFVSEKLCFSYESVSSPPILVVNLSTGENTLPWQHGITLKKSNMTLDMKIYLELPKKGTFSFDRGNGLELRYKFENWNTSFNWVSASLDIGNKNLFALLNISGLENAEGLIKLVEEEPIEPVEEEEKPSTIGELNLSIDLFLTSIPQNLNLTMIRGSNTSLSWNANSSINGIYLNITREDNHNFYHSHLIVRNAPVKADFTITSGSKEITVFHIPEINVSAPDGLDFNLKLDGELVGSESDFLLYTEGLKKFSLKAHDNTVRINSIGNKLLLKVNNALEGMKEIEILSLDLQSLRLTANFIFGKFPVLEVNCNAKETQINLIPSIGTPFGEKNSIALTDVSLFSLNIRKNSIRITDTKTHYITAAPILSLWW